MFWNVPIYDPLHLLQLSATSNLFLCPYFFFYIFKARKRQYMDQVDSATNFKEIHSFLFSETWFKQFGAYTKKVSYKYYLKFKREICYF